MSKKVNNRKGAKTSMAHSTKTNKGTKHQTKKVPSTEAALPAQTDETLEMFTPEPPVVETAEVPVVETPADVPVEPVPEATPTTEASPAPEPDYTEQAAKLLGELHFEKTGEVLQEVRPGTLLTTAESWRDAKTQRARDQAGGVLARAGWYRRVDAPPLEALPDPEPPPSTTPDLEALRVEVVNAKAGLDAADADAKRVEEEAKAAIAKAKEKYRAALAPYRDACKVQKVTCEFESGGRGKSLSEHVRFETEKVDGGIRVRIKDRPETEEVLTFEALRASVNKVAYGYTDKHIGLRDQVGNKGGSLSNRLRALLGGPAQPSAE